MKHFLSVYFSIDRTYFTITSPTAKGLSLEYAGSTKYPIDLQHIEDSESFKGIAELEEVLGKFTFDEYTRISATLPADLALISQFPGKPDITTDELRMLVNLEIKQSYPQFNFEDFTSNVYHMSKKMDGSYNLMAIIIAKQDLESCNKALSFLRRPVDNSEISQINTHWAFLYNYPERVRDIVALFGVQRGFVDISVLKEGLPVYYNISTINGNEHIAEICEREFSKLTSSYVDHIDAAFAFGTGLTKNMFMTFWESAMVAGIEAYRMNAFRMVTPSVDDRMKQYCSRVNHIFPACIGGSIPAYHKRIKFY